MEWNNTLRHGAIEPDRHNEPLLNKTPGYNETIFFSQAKCNGYNKPPLS